MHYPLLGRIIATGISCFPSLFKDSSLNELLTWLVNSFCNGFVPTRPRSELESSNGSEEVYKVWFWDSDHISQSEFPGVWIRKLCSQRCREGPQYDALSSFGKQPKSINENPPEIHFPVGSRWFRRRREEEPPGPGTYNRKSGFLTQFAPSRQRSPEGAPFGTSTRKQRDEVYLSVEFDKAKYGTLSPGPSAYGARSTFGPQYSSPNRTAPLVGFIHDKRFKYHLMGRPGETTGPGQYDQKGSIGKQNEAYKDTLPAFSFGNATRDHANKVFISMEHDKINYGIQSPGPAIIKLKGCMGKQPSSRNRNPAFVHFGKGLRWQFAANDAPGPGTYDC